MSAHFSKRDGDRLVQLSNEAQRIARNLAQLAGEQAELVPVEGPVGPPREIRADTVMACIRARRARGRFFPDELFGDPCWDMLLALFHAELMRSEVPVSALCGEAAVPTSTALRWIGAMVDEGLFVRRPDPENGRRVFVELSSHASRAMESYFAGFDASGS